MAKEEEEATATSPHLPSTADAFSWEKCAEKGLHDEHVIHMHIQESELVPYGAPAFLATV